MKHTRLQALLVILFVATLSLAFWAWMNILDPDTQCSIKEFTPVPNLLDRISESIYLAIKAFFLSETYEASAKYCFDWRLQTARWTGLIVAIGALLQAGIAICFRPLARWRARQRSQHVVVVGSGSKTPVIAGFFAKAGEKVTHHTGDIESEHDDVLILPYATNETSALTEASLKGARRIIVNHDGDTHTVTDAVRIASTYPDTPVFAVINDPWLAKHARFAIESKTEAGDMLIPIAWPAAVSRAVLAKHPPFLLAEDRNQERAHIAIIGFDTLGQTIVEDSLNSSLVSTMDDPCFTLIDVDIDRKFASFLSRHAGFKQSSDTDAGEHPQNPVQFNCIEADFAQLNAEMEQAILSACGTERVTAFYICGMKQDQKLERALALRDLMRRNGICEAPIFLYAPDRMGLTTHKGGATLKDGDVIVFGDISDAIKASGMSNQNPDHAAMSYHAVYLGRPLDREASKAWKYLEEDFRLSNRRAVAHIPAKLFSLGIDIRPFLEAADLNPNILPQVDSKAMAIIEASVKKSHELAKLEHRRWMIDKRMDGWQYGPIRDDIKKLRPDMKPYESLDESTQNIDQAFVDWLKITLQKKSAFSKNRSEN